MDIKEALDKIDNLESELHALVEAVAARASGRRPRIAGLYEYVALNFPQLWDRFNGPKCYKK